MVNLTRRTLLSAISLLLATRQVRSLGALPGIQTKQRGARPLAGVSIAGAEFGETIPGVHGADYLHPQSSDISRIADLGFEIVRIPFLWERLEPRLDGVLAPAEWRRLSASIEAAGRSRLHIVLDMHNYAQRRIPNDAFAQPYTIGSPEVPVEAFVRVWGEIARRVSSAPHVVLGLMNEPGNIAPRAWLQTANAAIAAIRAAPSLNLVLVSGAAYSGAYSWYEAGNTLMVGIDDPASNFAIEVHQYLDADASGSEPRPLSSTIGSERIAAFQEWARARGIKAFLGEFGAGGDMLSIAAVRDLLSEIEANPDVWIGWSAWAAGRWWGDDYAMSLERNRNGDWPAQMRSLSDFARQRATGAEFAANAAIAVDFARQLVRGADGLTSFLAVDRPSPARAPNRSGRTRFFAGNEARCTDLGLLIERPGTDLASSMLSDPQSAPFAALHELPSSQQSSPSGDQDARRLVTSGGRISLMLEVDEPGVYTFAIYVKGEPSKAPSVAISAGSAEGGFDLATCTAEVWSGEAAVRMTQTGEWRRLELTLTIDEVGPVEIVTATQPPAKPEGLSEVVEIASPTFEKGTIATHYAVMDRVEEVVTLAGEAARLVSAERLTLLVETSALAPAPGLRPIVASESTLLLARSAAGRLVTGLGGGREGALGPRLAEVGRCRFAIALNTRLGQARITATGTEVIEVGVQVGETAGSWRIGGFGEDALDGHVTRIALFAEALDAASLSALVA